MKIRLVAVVAVLLCAAGARAQSSPTTAHAVIADASGKTLGAATLTQTTGGVQITATLSGLPAGTHAIHVHTVGKCEAPGFTSAGGHFNPESKKHGMKNPEGSHMGDLPNFDVEGSGTAHISVLAAHATLGEGPNSLFHEGGTALVIHAAADDYTTDPTGNAGARIACGVIDKQTIVDSPNMIPPAIPPGRN